MSKYDEAAAMEMVAQFIDTFDVNDPELYEKLLIEEAKEVREAFLHLLKEVADFMYVFNGLEYTDKEETHIHKDAPAVVYAASGIANIFTKQLGPLLNVAIYRVHKSNMSKLDDNGKPVRREDGKILKGPNYKAPDFEDLVVA